MMFETLKQIKGRVIVGREMVEAMEILHTIKKRHSF